MELIKRLRWAYYTFRYATKYGCVNDNVTDELVCGSCNWCGQWIVIGYRCERCGRGED